MAFTMTKQNFFKNFVKENNEYVGNSIDFANARTFNFENHQGILKDIEKICENKFHKKDRLIKVVSVCFNILLEKGIDISDIEMLKELFKHFSFFIATISPNNIYYECPCTQHNLKELDWFSILNTEDVFYVGSECVNKFDDENFKTEHIKKLREQLANVRIDGLLNRLNTTKEILIYFCKFNYPEICNDLNEGAVLTIPQLKRLEKEIKLNWSSFLNLGSLENYKVAQFVRDHRNIFRQYVHHIDENYQEMFLDLLKKRKLTPKQLNALGIDGKIILKKER